MKMDELLKDIHANKEMYGCMLVEKCSICKECKYNEKCKKK